MSRKDTYRQKVYNAENKWVHDWGEARATITIEQARPFLDAMVKHFGVQSVRLEQNRRLQQWSGWYRSYRRLIEVHNAEPQLKTVLHEFAHHLDAQRRQGSHCRGI